MIRALQSPSAALRLAAARRFLDQFAPGDEVLLLGASRGAVDDLARSIAKDKGATFGLHRFSFTQLAARIAANELAAQGRAPSSGLGHEAVAVRAAFEATHDKAIEYFAPVAQTPGFPKALVRTLLELRLAGIASASITSLSRSGSDLAELLDRVEALMADAGTSDRASLFTTGTKGLAAPENPWAGMPLLLLDVPFDSDAESAFLSALVQRAPTALITIADGDERTIKQLAKHGGGVQPIDDPHPNTDLTRLSRFLFSSESPPERKASGDVIWFSAPGEERECIEIARRMLKEAAAGVRFDEMAILIRSPQQYIGVLEHSLSRAEIPAYFDRGLRRPHPAGRAFLAILSCAVENLSAKRFAEYLSLGQVPQLDSMEASSSEPSSSERWVTSNDEVLGVLSEGAAAARAEPVDQQLSLFDEQPAKAVDQQPSTVDDHAAATNAQPPTTDQSIVAGTLRAPWKWEGLLVESAVIGGSDRWTRRLRGLAEQYRLQLREIKSEEPDSPRIPHLERELKNLEHLRGFALPLIETMSAWPARATWGHWIQRLEDFAPLVLKKSDDVRKVLADLRPMGTVGPVPLTEVHDVLADRLRSLEVDPPANRYGRVFVGSPHQARGRSFKIVFVPGLAERMFPQKLREDPLLLDMQREELGGTLTTKPDRADLERFLLRLAIGSASDRLYVSFPRIDAAEARARVPSFYALEIMRAVTGRIPDHQSLERAAAEESRASLAWPAPVHSSDAIDDLEHDLSVLRGLMLSPEDRKGHAHYMLTLNDSLRRSVLERWARAQKGWSHFDGLVRTTESTLPYLETQRLNARPYSVSALQKYAACPYQFFLSAAYRLAPLEEPEPLQRMDPLTKGSLFHQVQAEFFRALQKEKLAITAEHMDRVLAILDETLSRIAAEYSERLAPAIDRVWNDEIAAIRTDLRVWVDRIANDPEWEPWLFEFAFGLPEQPGHDPESLPDPVTIGDRFILRGSIDLIERRPGTRILRVTDHKTSKNRSEKGAIIGGGAQLQPVIYSLAIEKASLAMERARDATENAGPGTEKAAGLSVETARFSYCTTAGGFTEHVVPINERTRRLGIEVLEIIDRAVETGMLPPAPKERACRWCDFFSVCGPEQERRANRKSKKEIADLLELRDMR